MSGYVFPRYAPSILEIAGPDNSPAPSCHHLDKAETIFGKWGRERRQWLTGPKVKAEAVSRGAGRRNLKPFQNETVSQPSWSPFLMGRSCGATCDIVAEAERPYSPQRHRSSVPWYEGNETRNTLGHRSTYMHSLMHTSIREEMRNRVIPLII